MGCQLAVAIGCATKRLSMRLLATVIVVALFSRSAFSEVVMFGEYNKNMVQCYYNKIMAKSRSPEVLELKKVV